jgi:transcriptional regulator with XRE-family HTH domain
VKSDLGTPSWQTYVRRLVDMHGSAKRLAHACDVDEARISHWITHGSVPSVSYLRQLASKLHQPLPILICIAYEIPISEMAAHGAVSRLREHDDGEQLVAAAERETTREVPRSWR